MTLNYKDKRKTIKNQKSVATKSLKKLKDQLIKHEININQKLKKNNIIIMNYSKNTLNENI